MRMDFYTGACMDFMVLSGLSPFGQLSETPKINTLSAVGGHNAFSMLHTFVVGGALLVMMLCMIGVMVIRNPKAKLEQKQKILDKLVLVALASGGIFFLNVLKAFMDAAFFR